MLKRESAFLALGLCSLIMSANVQASPPNDIELALLPAYCQAKYGKDKGGVAADERWTKTFGYQNWLHMHHYCGALTMIIRADRSRGREARFHLAQARRAISSSLTEQTQDWSLRPEAHVKLGNVLSRLAGMGQASPEEAAVNFEKAREIDSAYAPAYIALADFYAKQGNTKKAVGYLEQGLSYGPSNRALTRRYKEFTGKEYAPLVPSATAADAAPAERDTAAATEKAQPNPPVPAAPQSANAAEPAAPEPKSAAEPKIGSPSNPWCRFCPDPAPDQH